LNLAIEVQQGRCLAVFASCYIYVSFIYTL